MGKKLGLVGWLASAGAASCLVVGVGYGVGSGTTPAQTVSVPVPKSSTGAPAAASPQTAIPATTMSARPKPAPKVSRTAKPAPKPSPTKKPRKPKTAKALPAPPPARLSVELVVSSFNALGSQHTSRGGKNAGMASGQVRARWAAQVLAQHGVDVVGFQELRSDQLRAFLRVAGGTYDVYPGFQLGNRETVNSIAWRKDKWQLVEGSSIRVPYFKGELRPKPVVLLEHRATGLRTYFANFHNPASIRKWGDAERFRDRATEAQVGLANRLAGTGLPVVFTGDMNEREEYFCRLTSRTPMHAANGGSNSGGCRPPRPMNVDWIFGSDNVQFSGFTVDRSPLVNRTTDHPVIVSRARVEGPNPAIAEAARALAEAQD